MRNRILLGISLIALSHQSYAATLPTLNPQMEPSPHKLFVSSQTNNEFDSWKIDSGYSYSLFDSIDLYVGARIDNASIYNENGFLSGVSYTFNEKLSVKSTILTKNEFSDDGTEENTMSAEVTSRMKISEHLDLHATVDYAQWQQGIEIGLGFRF